MRRSIYDLVSKGQKVLVNGTKGQYQITKPLKNKFIFQGHLEGSYTPVVLKFEDVPSIYEAELNAYNFPCIYKSRYFRTLEDIVENDTDRCLVFEWMDTTLWSIRRARSPMNPKLPKVVAKSVLEALAALAHLDGQGPVIHSDVHPNNIFVSGADTAKPIVKLGDMGGLVPAGVEANHRGQGLEIRAPEVWKKAFTSPACDEWSLGVSLVHYLAGECIFGANDMNIRMESVSPQTAQAAWCIGKIIRLIGPVTRDENLDFKEEFDLAEALVESPFLQVKSLEEELAKFGIHEDCIEFIRHLFIMDPDKRPTAAQALEHPWFQDIQ